MPDPAKSPTSWTISIPKPSMASTGLLGGLEARGFWLAAGALAAMWWTGHMGPNPSPIIPPAPVPTPTPGPVVPATEFFRLGQGYRGAILSTYAAAIDKGADSVAAGSPVDKALATIGSDWAAARTAAFNATIAPRLEAIAPAGSVPDPAKLAGALRDLAQGIKSGN